MRSFFLSTHLLCSFHFCQLRVVLACLRAQRPFRVATLSLRRCPAFQWDYAEESAALLVEFLAEVFFNPAPLTSVDKRPRDACLEVLYLGNNGLETAMAEGSTKCPGAIIANVWMKRGCLHKPLPELPPPPDDASNHVYEGPPLTLRRKSKAYWGGPGGPSCDAKRGAQPPPCSAEWRLARLSAIPARWRDLVDVKPKAKKGGGGGGKKNKKK